MHRVRKSLALLSAAGIDVKEHAARYEVPEDSRKEAESTLDRAGLSGRNSPTFSPPQIQA
jgi:hypothetical protein